VRRPRAPAGGKRARLPAVTKGSLVETKENTMTGHAEARRPTCFLTGCLTAAAMFAACLAMTAATAQERAPDYAAIVAAPDRTDADLQTDKRRDPVKLLSFTGARPSMKVLDMGAGGGYSTELMARAAAPAGVVYGQNPADISERAKTRFEARLKTPGGKNIVSLERQFDDPLPADVRDLDLITFLFFYHDTTYMPVDRAEMNRKLFAALKPGGMLVIADPTRKIRRRHLGRQEPASHRGERIASRSRSGRIQARRRRRFLAPPRGCARLFDPAAERQSGRRVRAQISEANVSGRQRA
jgi:predicted methyltransferase